MARRASLTPETLTALGADRLAKLIVDEAHHNAPFKRIVTAALAGAKGPAAVVPSSTDGSPAWSVRGAPSTGTSARLSPPT